MDVENVYSTNHETIRAKDEVERLGMALSFLNLSP